MAAERYDPFVPGPFAVGVRTLEIQDGDRSRVFPCEIWYPALRAVTLPGEAAWMTAAMLPMSQLCPGEHGHAFARGLSLAHLDAVLRGNAAAERFLADGAENALAVRGVEAVRYCPA